MPTKHVFFYPYPFANCSAEPKKGEGIKNFVARMATDPKAILVFTLDKKLHNFNRNGYDTEDIKDPTELIKTINPKDTLYICGHAAAGGDEISSPDERFSVKCGKIVDYLKLLPKEWAGRVKIYGCESANSSGPFFWRSQPLAKRIFDEIGKTHPRLSIWGYTHEVGTWPTLVNGTSHKLVDAERTSKYLNKIQ